MKHKVTFHVDQDSSVRTCEGETGETLVQVANRQGIVIQQTCGNTPSCADCRVFVKEGLDTGLEAPEGPEIRLMGNVFHITRERLSCQAVLKGDVVVQVPVPKPKRKKT